MHQLELYRKVEFERAVPAKETCSGLTAKEVLRSMSPGKETNDTATPLCKCSHLLQNLG